MKKIILLTILCVLVTNCSVDRPPNPGFRVETLVEIRTGIYPFYEYIPTHKRGTVTSGHYYTSYAGDPPQNPTGLRTQFTSEVSNFAGQFDVIEGRAPGFWFAETISGWDTIAGAGFSDNCNGQTVGFTPSPGSSEQLVCKHFGGSYFFFTSPSSVNQYEEPVELQTTVNAVNIDNGMPIFHFEDYTGQLIAMATATRVSGNYIWVSSSCLMDKPIGTYSVKIYNAPSPNSVPSQPIGLSGITVREAPQPTCTYGYEQDIQACQSWGWTWDYNACQCHVQ